MRRRLRSSDFESGPSGFRNTELGNRIPMTSLIQVLAVAHHLNIRQAARALGTSQSCVSARIKTLEQDLGMAIFERHPRGVRLTKAGQHFADRVALGIDHLDQAVKTAGMLSSGRHGHLRIGLYSPISVGFLGTLLARYRNQYDGVHIEVVEASALDMIHRVRKGSLDLALVGNHPTSEDCHSRQLWTEKIVIAMPVSHPLGRVAAVTWGDIGREKFIVQSDGPGPQIYDHIARRLFDHGCTPSIQRLEVCRDTLLHLVAQKEGVTLVTDTIALVSAPGLVFKPIIDELEPARFSAIWSPHNSDKALRNFLDVAIRASRVSSSA